MTPLVSRSRTLVVLCAVFYLCVVTFLVRHVIAACGGHFVYALDDPYIHLALAENLARGHYGINPGEYTSPSSSIVWPFLLAPFASRSFFVYVPLVWNVLFGLAGACLIGWFVARWPQGGRAPSVAGAVAAPVRVFQPGWQLALTAILLLFTANLPSLAIVGMEHSLQVLLAICCAVGVAEALSGSPLPPWCLAVAIVAPVVRYEDLTLTLAVCTALAGGHRWRTAALVFLASLLPLLLFSVWLHHLGLPLLPLSVLVKGHAYGSASPLLRVASMLKDSLKQDLTIPERYPTLVLTLLFLGLAFGAPTRLRRFVLGGTAALGMLQLVIGRFGWFFRYEVYALTFLTLLLVRVLAERPRFLFGYFALGLTFCASNSIGATAATASASLSIYEQQYQMHRFVTEFYRGDYAVNDLGLVSYNRRPGAYVLDVYGLASVEASKQTDKSAEWLSGVVRHHNVALAMLYPEWFHIPPSWVPLAQMCRENVLAIKLGYDCMVFYSTTQEAESGLRSGLTRFAPTLPSSMSIALAPPGSTASSWLPPALNEKE